MGDEGVAAQGVVSGSEAVSSDTASGVECSAVTTGSDLENTGSDRGTGGCGSACDCAGLGVGELLTAPSRSAAAWIFFRQWMKAPLSIASVVPSGQQLASRMLAQLPDGTQRVVEIGAGTGVFTQAMLDRGLPAENLLVVERNAELFHVLRRRFPTVRVVHGDAADLPAIVSDTGFADESAVDAVISSLGFRAMSHDLQRTILLGISGILAPGASLVQFTYGRSPSMAHDVLERVGMCGERVSVAWRNFPPASVFLYKTLPAASAN
ncbi:MAG: methyltransferase domain-containing protein [Nakamurella sp.]